MMNRYIITLFIAALWNTAWAKDIVIDRPAFRSSDSDMYPVKVELTKKATIVHFRAFCACWRDWRMVGARLECDGQRYAYKEGRIITHEGKKVLADEMFELGRQYTKNPQQDSLILYFDPLPKGVRMFDYVEGDNEGDWQTRGIRLDGRLYPSALPAYQAPVDDGRPLQPLKLAYGEATADFKIHGGGGVYYFGDPSRDPVTGNYESRSQYSDSTLFYCHPAYVATRPVFIGCKVDAGMTSDQFPLILIPGETFTLEVDVAACMARDHDFAAGKPAAHDCYRVGGTLGDLNQVLLENEALHFRHMKETPEYSGQTFPAWRDELWQNLDTLRQGMAKRRGYTHRQQDFLRLLLEDCYVRTMMDYQGAIAWKMKLHNPDSTLARLKETYTLADPHAKDLLLYHDGRTFYLPLYPSRLPYLEANGLDHGEVYEMMKGFNEALKIGKKIKVGEVQKDSVIQAVHPYFQPVLRAFNDSTRVLVERLQKEAKERMMPTPDVPADQLLDAIVAQHPGKAVFFDFWATWCVPCMNGIRAMEPMKEEMKDRNVVFVYMTDESSPMKEWSEQVIRIPGLHYRIPSSLWSKIPGLGGIPQYYLYAPDGQRVWEQTGFGESSLETIKNEISKIGTEQ